MTKESETKTKRVVPGVKGASDSKLFVRGALTKRPSSKIKPAVASSEGLFCFLSACRGAEYSGIHVIDFK
jgi:hypothetical protein